MIDQTLTVAPKFPTRSYMIKKLRESADSEERRFGDNSRKKVEDYLLSTAEVLQTKSVPATIEREQSGMARVASVNLFWLYRTRVLHYLADELESGQWDIDSRMRYLSFLTLYNSIEYHFDTTAEKPDRFSALKHRVMGEHLGQLCLLGGQTLFRQFTALYLNKCEQKYDTLIPR